jgi:hypothetical protein
MEPGDIMIVYSLGTEANARRPAVAEPLGPKTQQGRIRVRAAARRPVRRRVRGGQFNKRSTGWFDRGQPCGTDGASPSSFLAESRLHQGDR